LPSTPLNEKPTTLNSSATANSSNRDDKYNFRITMGLGIGLSVLLISIIGGVCACLYQSRKKKVDFLQGKAIKVPQKAGSTSHYETTQIGSTIEDLRSRQDTVIEVGAGHTKSNSQAVLLSQIHELKSEEVPEIVHPI
jgi:hypothetical protein